MGLSEEERKRIEAEVKAAWIDLRLVDHEASDVREAREVVLVSPRGEPEIQGILERRFGLVPGVWIIEDRRMGERRQRVKPVAFDARRRDRRRAGKSAPFSGVVRWSIGEGLR